MTDKLRDVLFNLDGTLEETLEDLANATNVALGLRRTARPTCVARPS